MMNHIKTYHKKTRLLLNNPVVMEGPLSSEKLKQYHFHEDLTAFRPAPKQFKAILDIADFPEGRLIVARTGNTIIGYVTYLYPDPMERWSKLNMENLLELGVVEVIPAYRGKKIASDLLKVSMMDDYMEHYIVISTEYYWHWDLKREALSVWGYRQVMEKMMAEGGLFPAPTDDPEIMSHPANCLMLRIGRDVSADSVNQFERLRFLQREQHRHMREGL